MAMSIHYASSKNSTKREYDDAEGREQTELIKFMDKYFPRVRIDGNINGVHLTMPQAAKAKRMGMKRDCPDLHLKERRGDYHCLYIEYKSDKKNSIYKLDGELKKDDHVLSQAQELNRLQQQGDAATFAVGLENAIQAIKDYLDGKFTNPYVFKKCKYS